MFDDFSIGGAAFEPGLIGADGRLTRFHKGASTAAAEKEQRKAREQSARQFAQTMAFQEKQFRAAQAIHVPEVEPMPPPPTMSTADAEASALEMRRAQLRRYGFRRTVRAGGAGGAVGGGRGLGGTMEVAA